MRWLPPIVVGASELYWPLTDASSSLVQTALLVDIGERETYLVALLAEDPAFCAWAVVRAALDDQPHFTTCAAVSSWLAPRIAGYFYAALDLPPWTEFIDSEWREQIAERAAVAIITARLAMCYGHDADGEITDEDVLAVMLDSAEVLLEIHERASDQSVTGRPRPTLADTIGHDLAARLRATGATRERLDRARAAIAGEGELPHGWDRAILDIQLATVREEWNFEDGRAWRRLPQLLIRLRRLEQLETQFQTVLEREKLESLRQLAYGAGHEINNPLANISARAQTLIKEERDPERRRRLAAINSQAYRAHEMIADLMLFSRPPQLHPERFDLVALVDRVIRELLPEAQQRGASIERRLGEAEGNGPTTSVLADGVQLAVALKAMCVNSLEALGPGGSIVLTIRPFQEPAGRQWIELIVADDGPGIKPEVRRHIFDPFYSGREAGRGLGFGLSKCWRIVTDHGGKIDVDSPAAGGAVFTIRLPAG